MPEPSSKIKLYGTPWCGDTRRARMLFDSMKVPYEWIDIEKDSQAAAYVQSVNNGFRSVPTIVFPDGSMLVEPNNNQLQTRLKAYQES